MIIGYIVLAVVVVLLGIAIWRVLRRRSASCCDEGSEGGRAWGKTGEKTTC